MPEKISISPTKQWEEKISTANEINNWIASAILLLIFIFEKYNPSHSHSTHATLDLTIVLYTKIAYKNKRKIIEIILILLNIAKEDIKAIKYAKRKYL